MNIKVLMAVKMSLLMCVVTLIDTNVVEEHTLSIFSAEDGGSMFL
jgi:hypothetical protein